MPEFDQQLDTAQAELTKLAEGKQTGPMKVAEDIFKSGGLVDTFQTIGKAMNLESSPAAMKYLEQGGGEVAAILMQMAAAGKYLAENPDTEDLPENLRPAKKAPRSVIPGQEGKEKRPLEGGTNASSDINAMAFNVRTKIKEYQEKLKPISEIVAKGREAYPNIEKAIMKETEFDAGNIAPRDFMQIMDNAIFGPDGADGLCGVRKLIENNQGLPAEFLAEMEKSFNRKTLDYYVTKKTHVAQEDLILTFPIKVEKPGEPGQFVEEGLAKYVDLKKPAKPDGEWEIVFTEAGNKLSPGTKLKILEALASVKIGIDEQVEEATCPRIAENFWKGQILLEEGKFEDAKKLLTQFRDQDMKSYDFQNNPKLKAKEQDYLARTEAMLKQIEEVTGSNKVFFDAQKLAESGDIYGAKKLLKKYLAEAEQRAKDHPDSKDFSGTAKEMIRRISLTQLEGVKQKFFELLGENEKNKPQKTIHIPGDGETPGEDYDNPDYEQYAKCRKAIQDMEEGLTNGTYADFEEAFKAHGEGLKVESKWNQLGDEMAIETKGREALLDLARKYRSQKNYALAEEYFQRYFGKQLEGTRKKLTMEEIAQRYRGNVHFGVGIAKRVDAAKEKWEARDAEIDKWNTEHPDMPKEKTAWDGRKAWDLMEAAALREVYGLELQREQNAAYKADPSAVGDAGEQKAWGEFMNMKGEHGQGEWWEPFAMSDATLDGIIERLPLDIALIAISGGIAGAASRAVTSTILRAGLSMAEREVFAYGVTGGARAIIAPVAGLLAETTVFTMSHAVLSAARDGRFSFDSFGGFMGEWWENLKIMGGLGMVGRLAQGVKAGFIAANAMEITGMAALSGGQMDLHTLGMVAGLKISHAVPAAFSANARLERASRKAESLGTDANEAVRKAMEYRAANGGKADPKLDAAARSAVEKARSASAEAETILAEILVEQEKANPQKPPEAAIKEPEIPAPGEKTARAIDSHYYSQFSARPPKELWSDPSKPETSKNVAGWIDAEGKIHYNSEYFEAQYKVKMAEKEGKNVFIVDGKEMTPMEYFRTAEGKEVLQEMKRVKDHEVTHRILEFGQNLSEGTLAQDLAKFYKDHPNIQVHGGGEMDFRRLQELTCAIADGSVKVSDAEKVALEKLIQHSLPEFRFEGVRNLDTRLLTQLSEEALRREQPDALDVQFVRSGKINIPGYSFDGTEIASFDAKKRTVKLIRTIGNGMVTFEDVSISELARRAREQSEKQMQPLTLGQSVKSFASDGSIRQGWFVQSIGPNGEVVIAGYKNGMAAKKTYDSMELLQREMRDAETVLKYKDTKFGLYSSKLGRGADGWEFGTFDPEKGSIQMTNSLTRETRTFRSVDEALMEIKLQEVMEGRKAYKHKAYTQFADMMQVNEFGRPKITSESETIDGGVFAPDIIKTKGEAIVVDTQKDVVLKNYIDGFMRDLDARIARGERLKPDEILQMVAKKISGDFPYSDRMLDRNYADANYQGGKKYNLGVFMSRQDMVCRHMGLLAQIMIEKIKANPAYQQVMEGVSSNFMADRQEVITDSDRSGHAYAIVAVPTPQGKKYYTIDPTRKNEPMRDLGRVVRESKLNGSNARYLFSLLRTIFEKPDPSNAGILAEIFGKEKDLPALRQIARDALTATRNPDARAGVDTFRSQMGLPPL